MLKSYGLMLFFAATISNVMAINLEDCPNLTLGKNPSVEQETNNARCF